MPSNINLVAVLLSAISFQLLGAAWFMGVIPLPYAKALGRSDLAGRKPAPIFIVGPMLCGVIVSLANALLMRWLNITTLSQAMVFALISGIGYLVSMTVNIAINPNIPRPLFYAAINAPHFVLGNLASCATIAAMG